MMPVSSSSSASASESRTMIETVDSDSQLLREQTTAQIDFSSASIQIEEYAFVIRNTETERY
jgi:hypothetical protein